MADTIENFVTKDGFTIYYVPETSTILTIHTKDKNISDDLGQSWFFMKYHAYLSHLYDCVEYCEDVKIKMFSLFDLAYSLKDERNDLSCMICSHVFAKLTSYPKFLRLSHLYFNMIIFWRNILKFLKEWEQEKADYKIHRGSIYGYIGEVFAFINDYETAFSHFHRAVQEDSKIKEHLKGFPKEAPGYKIVTLNKDAEHFMGAYILAVREFLKFEIEEFAKMFSAYNTFNMEEFDRIFIDHNFFDDNDYYENIKINVSYYIWQTFYYNDLVDRSEKSSSFDNLNRLQKLSGMCLMLESILKELNPKVIHMKNRIAILYTHIGGKNDFVTLYNLVTNKEDPAEVNKLITDLLDYNKNTFEGEHIDNIDRCILTHSLIRNFTAHNLKSVEMIGDRFFDIARIFLFTFFIFLIELDKKGYKM